MRKKNSKLWMKLLLVFALVAGLALPAGNVSAASKSEKKKVLIVFFRQQGRQKVQQKRSKRQQAANCIRSKPPSHIQRQI
jgi:hypothetical protein